MYVHHLFLLSEKLTFNHGLGSLCHHRLTITVVHPHITIKKWVENKVINLWCAGVCDPPTEQYLSTCSLVRICWLSFLSAALEPT